MSELAGLVLALVAAMGALGTTGAFVWNKIEKRFGAVEAELAKCQQREKSALERGSLRLTVIELLWQEIHRLSPEGSAVLTRAKNLLNGLRVMEATRMQPETDPWPGDLVTRVEAYLAASENAGD